MKLPKTNLLLIEDNHDNQQLICWILEDEGYTLDCADTAEKGLALLNQNDYRLVLMDISLPGIDGKEATKIIRNTPKLESTIIIAITAHAVLQERELILTSGVDDMLTKPVDEEELISTINKHLNT